MAPLERHPLRAPLTATADELEGRVRAALMRSPHVRGVRLVGSRSTGRASALSDWDFLVETDDIDAVAAELPQLVAPLEPLGQLWDPISEDESSYYMLILRGPVKVDLVFERPNVTRPPWEPSAENLVEIDAHFWDFLYWIASKREKGEDELVAHVLQLLAAHILRPLGVEEVPATVERAAELYVEARERAETRFSVRVPRALGDEVRLALVR